MKKLLSVLLFLLTLTVFAAAGAEEASAWTVGEQHNGFTVTDVRRFELVGADAVTLVHDTTGAQVLLVLNDDTNRVFDITFHTVAENSTGAAHVFEHATLDGSEKYPSADLFFSLMAQTYNTYMNASTGANMTTYPVASLSEAQLLCYADFYLDSCFHPLIMTEESIFAEEAWRYELTDAEGELTLTGTVYNEMLGAYDISRAALFNAMGSALPGGTAGNVSGGKPSDIPDLTWEDLKAYHDKYYHPSNSLTCIYGRLEQPEEFLRLLDEAFSGYEAQDYTGVFDDTGYTPLEASVTEVFDYPVEEGVSTEQAACIYYCFPCTGATETEIDQLAMLMDLLSADGSPLMQAMKTDLPSATVEMYVMPSTIVPLAIFSATGVDESDAETFRQIVNDALAAVAETGLDQDMVDACSASFRLSTLLATESSSVGVTLITSIASMWASLDDPCAYMNLIAQYDTMAELAEDGTYQALIGKYLSGEAVTSLSVTRPVPGLKEQEDAALTERLAGVKAAMSEEELAALVERTNAPQETAENTAVYVQQLTAVTVESLPEETRIYQVTDEVGEDSVRRMFALANVSGVGTSTLRLDLSAMTEEELMWCQLFIDLLGDMDTTAHSAAELDNLATRYLYDGDIAVRFLNCRNDESTRPMLRITFTALDEDLQAGWDLVWEMLFDTDFADTGALADRVGALYTTTRNILNNANAFVIMLYRLEGTANSEMKLFSDLNGLAYCAFLEQVTNQLAEDPQAVVESLQAVQTWLKGARTGAISAYTGTEAGYALHNQAVDALLAGLTPEERTAHDWELNEKLAGEALIVNTGTSFNLAYASLEELGLEEMTADWSVIAALVQDRYLLPQLRDKRGAYGAYCTADGTGLSMYSYRDPGVAETFEVYRQVGQLLAEDTIDQETLNGYILSAYSTYALSSGELDGGMTALVNLMLGEAQEDALEDMRTLKQMTVDSLPAYAEVLNRFADSMHMATVSSASTIEENAALYTSVLDPFGTSEASGIADVSADDPAYTAILYCVQNGLMQLKGEKFAPEAELTLGDAAATLYVAIGGSYDPEEAISFLSGYGILPYATTDMVVTRERMVLYLTGLYETVGGTLTDVPLGDYPDADQVTSGSEELWGWCLSVGLVTPTEEGLLAPTQPATRSEWAQAAYVFFGE